MKFDTNTILLCVILAVMIYNLVESGGMEAFTGKEVRTMTKMHNDSKRQLVKMLDVIQERQSRIGELVAKIADKVLGPINKIKK